MQIGGDPSQEALVHCSRLRGRAAHLGIELRVALEQPGKFRDAVAELAALRDDGLAASAHHAEQHQVHDRHRGGDHEPAASLRGSGLAHQFIGRLVELGHTDDPTERLRMDRCVRLDEPWRPIAVDEAMCLLGSLDDLRVQVSLERCAEARTDRKRLADGGRVGAVRDAPVRSPDVERQDVLAQRRVGEQRVERLATGCIERIGFEQVLHVRGHEAVDVQARHRSDPIHDTALDFVCHPQADDQHRNQENGKARDQKLARKTQAVKEVHDGPYENINRCRIDARDHGLIIDATSVARKRHSAVEADAGDAADDPVSCTRAPL